MWRRLRARMRRVAVVLAYHRVAEVEHDVFRLAVSPPRFRQHLEHLERTCSIMRLDELGKVLRAGTLPPRAVAITFDDGYADFFDRAYPVLKASSTPATVFVPSALLGHAATFWWDELEALFYSPQGGSNRVSLRIGGQTHVWALDGADERDAAFWTAYKLLKPLSHEEREAVLRRVREKGAIAGNLGRPMTAGELACVAADELIEVGAHTITHATLPCLSEEEQRREIVGGRQRLAELLGRRPSSFAYPYGAAEDVTRRTVALVRQAGFSLAVTMLRGYVAPGDDVCRLRRCTVLDWPGDTFAGKLDSFFVS